MRTSEAFHNALLEAAKHIVTEVLNGTDPNDWDTIAAPFYAKVREAIDEGFKPQKDTFATSVLLSSFDQHTRKPAAEARIAPVLWLFDDDDNDDAIEGRHQPLSEIILAQYPDCAHSTLEIIEAVERSCAVARKAVKTMETAA